MSGARPSGGATPGAAPPGEPDPSMEDILASIRRILSEDETQHAAPPAEATQAVQPLQAAQPLQVAQPPEPDRPAPLPLGAPPPPAGAPASVERRSTVAGPAERSAFAAPTAGAGPLGADLAEPADDVLVLDPGMLVAEPDAGAAPQTPSFRSAMPETPTTPLPEPALPPAGREARPEQEASSAARLEAAAEAVPGSAPELALDQGPLVDEQTRLAAASSVGNLVRTLSAGRAAAVYRGGPTLEDLVRELLRPLLKDWLDSHLPPLVERLVATEIEKVVRNSGI